MGDRRRVKSDLNEDERMSMAAQEAFDYLNALQRQEYRGQGDTATAARDRAARRAGISRAQAERVWKRWQSMRTVNGDVYRALRNTYEAICTSVENAADAVEARRLRIEESHEADTGVASIGARDSGASGVKAKKAALK